MAVDAPEPKLPKALAPKSLRGATVSDLGEEHASLLGEVIRELDFPEAEISEGRNLSFLSELWLSEKMKGKGANKETMAKIEAIAISAASPFASRAHPSHKDGGGSEDAMGKAQSPRRARKAWGNFKLRATEACLSLPKKSKEEYYSVLRKMGLPANAENMASVAIFENAAKNHANTYGEGRFDALVACKNAVRSGSDLRKAAREFARLMRKKRGERYYQREHVLDVMGSCQSAINSVSDIRKIWLELQTVQDHEKNIWLSDIAEPLKACAPFAASAGEFLEIFGGYRKIAMEVVESKSESHYDLGRATGIAEAYEDKASTKEELMDYVAIHSAMVSSAIRTNGKVRGWNLNEIHDVLEKMPFMDSQALGEMRKLLETLDRKDRLTPIDEGKRRDGLARSGMMKFAEKISRYPEMFGSAEKISAVSSLAMAAEGNLMAEEMEVLKQALFSKRAARTPPHEMLAAAGMLGLAPKTAGQAKSMRRIVLRLHALWLIDQAFRRDPMEFDSFVGIFAAQAKGIGPERVEGLIALSERAAMEGMLLFSTGKENLKPIHDGRYYGDIVDQEQHVRMALYNFDFDRKIFSADGGEKSIGDHRLQEAGDRLEIYELVQPTMFLRNYGQLGKSSGAARTWELLAGGPKWRFGQLGFDPRMPFAAKGLVRSGEDIEKCWQAAGMVESRFHSSSYGWGMTSKIIDGLHGLECVRSFGDFESAFKSFCSISSAMRGDKKGVEKALAFLEKGERNLFSDLAGLSSLAGQLEVLSDASRESGFFTQIVIGNWDSLKVRQDLGKTPPELIRALSNPFFTSLGTIKAGDAGGAGKLLGAYEGAEASILEDYFQPGNAGEALGYVRGGNGDFSCLVREKGALFEILVPNRDFRANEAAMGNPKLMEAVIKEIAQGRWKPGKGRDFIEAGAALIDACEKAGEVPETKFFIGDALLEKMLENHQSSERVVMAGFHPVVACALASLGKWSEEEAKGLKRLFPVNGEINKEKYVRPVFVSFISEKPELQSRLIRHALLQGIASRDDQKILQLMSFTHSLGEEFLGFFEKEKFASMEAALSRAKSAAINYLSQKYPRAELEKMPERDLARWLSVFPEFEQTMKIHHDENLIPALRVLATIELLGKEREFALHDGKLADELVKNAESLFPDETMRPMALEYIAKWRAMENEKLLFPGKSAAQVVARLAEWKKPLRTEHVLDEISVVDRLEGAEKSLDNAFVKNHFCAEFVKIAGLYDGAATMKELADEYRRLKANGAVERGLEAVVARQNEIKKWSKLQSIFINYEKGFEEARNGIAQAGKGLAPFADTLKEWGFDYGDSFGNKVFLGELKALALKCETELKASPKDARLLGLSGKIQELEQACRKGNDYVLSIAELLSPAGGSKKGILAELYAKRDWAQGVLGAIENGELGFKAALSKVEKEQPQLYGIIKEEEKLDSQELKDALLHYTDLTAIADLEAIVATTRSEGSQKSQVFVYTNQPLFSKIELAMVGQCLDYRYSKNSIGNAPFTVSYMDPWRQVAAAYPLADEELESPKVNGLVFLADVSLEGKHETAVVMDRIYTSDKTDLGWSKVEGQVKFALQKASAMGMRLVVPDFLTTYHDNIRELAIIMGFEARESEVKVMILPGPAGATYCELVGYTHYEKSDVLSVNALVLEAAKR